MMTGEDKKIRQMPKGGRKGGSVFPRVLLIDAIAYARKLVSKTHTGAQPQDVIFSGVVGAKSGTGQVRISALKQYGLLKGDVKTNYVADDLAKKIVAAPPEELVPLYRKAVLNPTVFKKLFATFHGDTVSKGKLKQRAADLKVHPDETATCVDIYVAGMLTARLVTIDGDQVSHLSSSELVSEPIAGDSSGAEAEVMPGDAEVSEFPEAGEGGDESAASLGGKLGNEQKVTEQETPKDSAQSRPRAVFNVNVTLDSSLDTEKLQKQLELLKRFGAI